jgi:hypothetical protein
MAPVASREGTMSLAEAMILHRTEQKPLVVDARKGAV